MKISFRHLLFALCFNSSFSLLSFPTVCFVALNIYKLLAIDMNDFWLNLELISIQHCELVFILSVTICSGLLFDDRWPTPDVQCFTWTFGSHIVSYSIKKRDFFYRSEFWCWHLSCLANSLTISNAYQIYFSSNHLNLTSIQCHSKKNCCK